MPTVAATANSPLDAFRVPKCEKQVPTARARVRKTLADWGVTGTLADDVALSATELITNAVRHCRVTAAQIEVALSIQDEYLVLEVSDPDKDKLPCLSISADPRETGGRGLVLVAEVSDAWGHRQCEYVKFVWARFLIRANAVSLGCDGR
jgi:anti-sigma regulatory factor (Ser/Thr protein kinase)